jgi:hypothetical protein
VSSTPAHREVYSIQHYVIKFVSDLRQIGGFLPLLRFPPPIKTDRHDIAEILLKVALNTIILTLTLLFFFSVCVDNRATQSCEYWKHFGYCTVPEYETFMHQNCARTCNYCQNYGWWWPSTCCVTFMLSTLNESNTHDIRRDGRTSNWTVIRRAMSTNRPRIESMLTDVLYSGNTLTIEMLTCFIFCSYSLLPPLILQWSLTKPDTIEIRRDSCSDYKS